MGAIVIAKTNVPQTMMGFECVNPLWGRTDNPYNPHYSSGGSSGGEAAVLRFSGSALGLGSDVGGSLRIPTAYCGVFSLKPTDQRFSGRGAVGCVPGFVGITTVYGPMARSVADIKRACELYFGRPSTTPSVSLPPVKYRADLDFNRPLRIGYFKTAFIRAISSFFVKLFINDPSFAHVFVASRPRTVREFWAASAARIKANDDLQHHLWASTAPALGLDAVICPVQAVPCVPHGSTKTLTPMAVATVAWNVIECPVGVVPVTRVDPTKDAVDPDWLERGKTAGLVLGGTGDQMRTPSYLLERAVYGEGKRLLQPLDEPVPAYDAKKMAGLPVGVQIVGRPWEDEKVIHVMEVLDEALGERGFGPGMDEEWRS
ncbi:hypothetical protein FRC06_001750 [Ceratobasidium sp. 370]|nr:hypothetical protein FRC06_001750 [Ceratobasidium sp. 370]